MAWGCWRLGRGPAVWHSGGERVATAAAPAPKAAVAVCLRGVLPVLRPPGDGELMVFWGCCRRLSGLRRLSRELSQAREEQKLDKGLHGAQGKVSTSPAAVGAGSPSSVPGPGSCIPAAWKLWARLSVRRGGGVKAAVGVGMAGLHFVPTPPGDTAPQEAGSSGPNSPV